MGKEKRPFCCHQNFVPNGLSAPARGYIHIVKHEKNVYKIGLQSNFFFNLQQMFVPKGLSALAHELYTYIKLLKMFTKSDFFFLNLQQMGKLIRAFCSHQKFVPKRLYACIKSLNMCIKSDFEEIILKLVTNGQSDKGCLLKSTFVPKGLSAPALGLYTCIQALKYIPEPGVR